MPRSLIADLSEVVLMGGLFPPIGPAGQEPVASLDGQKLHDTQSIVVRIRNMGAFPRRFSGYIHAVQLVEA